MARKNTLNPVDTGLAATRALLGTVFLWAFFDKLFGLGVATPAARAWLNGGSPTAGFLGAVDGPFAGFFNTIAGAAWADWLFMLGLLGIGTALLLGIAMRLAGWSGALLMGLMWAASLPLANHPLVDDHIIYAMILIVFALMPKHIYSASEWWRSHKFVKKNKWLW